MSRTDIVVVGRGRVGQSLARALARAGAAVTAVPGRSPAVGDAATILIAVRDDVIGEVAGRLAEAGVGGDTVVLHCSGLLTVAALEPLRSGGASLGSFHPLMSFRDPAGSPELLAGTPAILEGDGAARSRGRQIAERLEMAPILEVPAAAKVHYHAAAVFASNYLVVLAGIAERLASEAGVGPSAGLFTPLMEQTLAHLATGLPGEALTGPIARGDAGTVARHLESLDGEVRELYRRLALEALALADLAPGAAEAVRAVLLTAPPRGPRSVG